MEKNIRKNIKTSYSISLNSYSKLKISAEFTGISIQKQIKIVMARYVRKLHRQLINDDNVISYNKHGDKGYERVYMRWTAKEYSIILQLKTNTRYSTSFMLEKALQECHSVIVMALLKRKRSLKDQFFYNLMMKLERFFIFWPNIDIKSNILPFFEMHLDYNYY